MTQTIKIRNEPAQHIGVANSAPCPEMNIITKEITENGRYEARAEGATGFDPVIVNVPSREEIGYENGYAAGYGKGSTDGYADALAKRTELEVTANGEYVPEGESTGFSKVSVNLPSGAEIEDAFVTGTLSGAYRNDRVTKIGNYAFRDNTKINSFDFPNVTSIGNYAMAGCTSLTSINIPNIESIGTSAFYGCWSLSSLNLESVKTISSDAFSGCWKFPATISLPLLTTVNSRVFQDCRLLSRADFPLVTTIQTQAFEYGYSLTKLILRSPTLCRLASTTAFRYCYHILGTVNKPYNPEGLKDGFIFVPDNLLEEYRQATNWTEYASQIKPLSELEE